MDRSCMIDYWLVRYFWAHFSLLSMGSIEYTPCHHINNQLSFVRYGEKPLPGYSVCTQGYTNSPATGEGFHMDEHEQSPSS